MMTNRLIVLLFLLALPALAQQAELGATIGGGAFGAEDAGLPTFVTFGLEACAVCSGHFALFGEVTQWQRVAGGARNGRINSVTVLAAGLRIQGRRGVRPFFDAGIAGGWDRFEYLGGRDSHGNPGLVLGGGAAIPLRGGWYIRPQGRLIVLRGFHGGFSGSVGIGYRFP
jgi:hypothetical protein